MYRPHGVTLYPLPGVFPPTDWNPDAAKRSAEAPNASLLLEFVYGYGGLDNTSPNLYYTAFKTVVYYTAAVAMVGGSAKFF